LMIGFIGLFDIALDYTLQITIKYTRHVFTDVVC
jgi:hypothetical protein